MNVSPGELAMLRVRRDGLPPVTVKAPRTRKESEIQKAILAYLATVPGVVAWKNGSGAFRKPYTAKDGTTREHFVKMGKRGVSDIIGWAVSIVQNETQVKVDPPVPGINVHVTNAPPIVVARFLAIEVKKPGRHPDEAQRQFLEAVTEAGGLALVARSVEDVRTALASAARSASAPTGAPATGDVTD